MKASVRESSSILAPLILAISFIAFASYRLLTVPPTGERIPIEVGLFSVPVATNHLNLYVLFGLGVVLLIYVFIRDYAGVFPDKLTFSVYFDLEGIDALLGRLRLEKSAGVAIGDEWKERCDAFQKKLCAEVQASAGFDIDTTQIQNISGRGFAVFAAKKNAVIRQHYRIEDLSGWVTYEIPSSKKSVSLRSFFELNGTAAERFRVDTKTMLVRHRFFIKPMLKQIYLISAGNEVVVERIIACTWVRFFPFIEVADTLYIVRDGETYTPIGYCSYDQ